MNLSDLVGDWDTKLHSIIYDTKVIENLNHINRLYLSSSKVIYPNQKDVFKAFKECPYNKFSVVILLQDPYHDGSATGIALANNQNTTISPSLRIVRNTIAKTVYKGDYNNFDSSLLSWEHQGVLMLNTALTVEKGIPLSHKELWDYFTSRLLIKLSEINSGIIYCLWGKYAEYYEKFINKDSNTILKCSHPAYSIYRGEDWKCDHFIKINEYLKNFNNTTIIW